MGYFREIFLSLSNNNILSHMGIKIGNVGFCIVIFICVLENDFWKQKLIITIFSLPRPPPPTPTPQTVHVCGGGILFSRPSVR